MIVAPLSMEGCHACVQDAELVHEWALRVHAALAALGQRPRNLLVFLNPFSGARRARRVWQRCAGPILDAAGGLPRLR